MARGKYEKKKKRILPWILMLSILLVLFVSTCFLLKIRITVHGEHEKTVEYGSPYAEEGASGSLMLRLFDKELCKLPIKQLGTVDTNKLGDYVVTYRANWLLFSKCQTRTVQVIDTQPPVIELIRDEHSFTMPGEEYREEGYHATDNADGDITAKVIRTQEDDNIRYTVTDSSGNTTTIVRIIVYGDNEAPVLTLQGDADMQINAGSTFYEPGYFATDNHDGDLTDKVEVTGEVDSYRAGVYELVYTVKDSFDNETTVKRKVTVNAVRQPDVVVPGSKTIYLTFDDGPGPYTQQLLDVLDKYNVKATFFVVNTGYASLIESEAAAGHSIGVHTTTHDYDEIYASEHAYFEDFTRMQDIIYEATGIKTTLLRFPGGSSNTVSSFNPGIMTRLTQSVTDMGLQYFDWNVSSGDAGETTDTEQVFQNVISGVQNYNASIVLQHDIKGYSVAAVEKIIIWGLANGYQFLPLSANSPKAHHGINN